MFIHKDVLEAMQNNYFSLIRSGTDLNQNELMDLIMVNNQLIARNMDEVHQEVKGFHDNYIDLQKRHQLTSKLFNHFLQLHNLEYEFDNYYERIDRRLRINKKPTNHLSTSYTHHNLNS